MKRSRTCNLTKAPTTQQPNSSTASIHPATGRKILIFERLSHTTNALKTTASGVFQDGEMSNFPITHQNAGKRGFRGRSLQGTIANSPFLLYKQHTPKSGKMILVVLEYIVGFAGVLVLSVLCLHHGRHISSQVCWFVRIDSSPCCISFVSDGHIA